MGELPSISAKHDLFTSNVEVDLGVIELLRQIVERVNVDPELAPSTQPASGTQKVVLDVNVGSSRYILTRAYLQTTALSATLSPREKEIVRLVAKGLPNKVISEVLDISQWTVATHLRRVFAKLGVSTRAEMIADVLSKGLLESNK